MTAKEKLSEAAAKLVRMRQAALAQADGTDATAIMNFMQAAADAYRLKRDDRRAELERRLADINSGSTPR